MVVKVVHVATVDMSLRYMLLNQMLSLQQAGYVVSGISAPGPEVPIVQAAGIRYIPVPMTRTFTPLADLAALLRLYGVMRREQFTIVHTHTPKAGLLGQLAARLARTPIIVNTVHGFYFHEHMAPHWRRFYIAIEKIAARCSDSILSQNQEDIDTALREGICAPSKIRFLGNGFDLKAFEPARRETTWRPQKRAELGLTADMPVVGFVGRLVAEKGLLEFLAAACSLVSQVPGVRFLIVGPTDYDKPDAITPDTARAYGIAEACIFTGRRHDMPELYALMDVLVLPSHREGYPRTPMEASFMGVPTVATDVRGCREVVEHGRNGLLVPRGDVPALAQAILTVLQNPALARTMGEAGHQMALARFDEQQVFGRVKSEYERLLAAKGMAAPAADGLKPVYDR